MRNSGIKNLMQQFTYIDAMVIDTPLINPATLLPVATVSSINDRLTRARIFCDYLDKQWAPLQNYQLPFSWPSVRAAADYNIGFISDRVNY